MSRHLRLAVPNADQDISLAQTQASSDGRPVEPSPISMAQTVASSDGRPSEAPPERSRAQIAFDETRVGESSAGGPSAGDEDLALSDTHLSGEPRPGLPAPMDDDRRMKALIKGRLLRSKAAPVKIGRYTVLDRLGEGGMGVVYTAYDDQLERKVAVKILRSESRSAQDIASARLKREAQAMARLSHPNIVTVHEVNEFDGQLFVAMEFVRGASLDGWLRKGDHPWREVLAVFLQAGRGLQAAHDAGIIHRDFKPHNVLVGDDGSVKVLDFGLARASEVADLPALPAAVDELPKTSLLAERLTQTGAIMGTPAYMAPEQHEGRAAVAASDQFAFCVSLYEGLYNQHPFDTTSLAGLIRDVLSSRVAPPPSSTRVPARLFKALQRGLAVDPAARHPSMAHLLAELARDPETQRRRVLASTGMAVFIGAASFGAAAMRQPAAAPVCAAAADELASTWSAERGEAVRSAMLATGLPYAGDTWAKIQPQLDAYSSEWVVMRTEACETHASGHQSDKLFDLRTACLDQRRAGFAGLVDALASADAAVVEKAAQAVAGLPSLSRCADASALTADVAPPEDPRVATRVQGLRETIARAKAQEDAGRYATAIGTLDPVLQESLTLEYPPVVAETALRLGSAQMEAGELPAADASFDRALWTAIASDHDLVAAQTASKRLFLRAVRMGRLDEAKAEIPLAQALSDHVAADIDVRAEFLNNLGAVHFVLGDPDRANTSMLAAVELRTANGRADSVEQAMTLANLGVIAAARGYNADATRHLSGAQTLCELHLGAPHPICLQIETALAYQHTQRGQFQRARQILNGILELTAGDPSRGPLLLATTNTYLGTLDLWERRREPALRRFARAIEIADADTEMAGSVLLEAQLGRAVALAESGTESDARVLFERTITGIETQFGADHPELSIAERRFADVLVRLGRAEEALVHLARADRRCAETDAHADTGCLEVQLSRGVALGRLGRLDEAEVSVRGALADYERLIGASGADTNLTVAALGELMLQRGRHDEAATLLRRAVDGYAATADADYPKLAEARLALAKALTGDATAASDEARALARQARDVFAARGEGFAAEAKAATDWLAAHGG